MRRVENFIRARKKKNDEFYTLYEDVEKELAHYPGAFRGKTVYCPCDDPNWSAFPKYFLKNFRKLGLKRLISTCYNGETGEGETPDMFAEPTGLTAWKLDVSDCDGEDIEGFVKAHIEKLNGNGDFRSRECVALLRESDIVCTNPPFSLFGAFFRWFYRAKKTFLVLGHTTAVSRKEIFPLIKSGEIFAEGFNHVQEFLTPEDGKIEIQIGWFTNLHSDRTRKSLQLTAHYTQEKYPFFDNYEAIEVSRSSEIPCDYDGVMGVPISFLEKYHPGQFEILGATVGTGEGARLNGKELFTRIFIRKRSENAPPCEMLLTSVREQCDDDEPSLFGDGDLST